jgi:sulfite dehydrogenase (quinone) subunit SoeA
VRVRVYNAGPDELKVGSHQFAAMPRLHGQDKRRGRGQAYIAVLFGKQ